MPELDPETYADHIDRDVEQIRAAAAEALDTPVPTCPDWTLADLVGHVGSAHRWVTEILRTGQRAHRPAPPPAEDLLDAWFHEGADVLLAALQGADPDADVWNWSETDQRPAFWRRRMAHETAVHRWDAENARAEARGDGTAAPPIDPALAADGIDEWFDVWLRRAAANEDAPQPEGSIHVHCTDVEGEWWACFRAGRVEMRRAHEKGDLAVRGAASDLLLVLWGRRPPSAVDLLGQPALLDVWLAATRV